MTFGEIALAALGSGGTAAFLAAVREWLRQRAALRAAEANATEASAEAGARVSIARMTHDERTEQRLWERIEALEAETRDCHQQRASDRAACDDEIRAATASVRVEMLGIAERLAGALSRRGLATTGVFEVEEMVRMARSEPPPPRTDPPPAIRPTDVDELAPVETRWLDE